MNVAEENVTHIFPSEPYIAKIYNDIVERGFWAGIKKRNAFIHLQRGRGDNAGSAKLASVENQRCLQLFDAATT